MSLCDWRRFKSYQVVFIPPLPQKPFFKALIQPTKNFKILGQSTSSWKRQLEISKTWNVLCGKVLSNFGSKYPTSHYITSFWTFLHITFELLDLSNSDLISKSKVYFLLRILRIRTQFRTHFRTHFRINFCVCDALCVRTPVRFWTVQVQILYQLKYKGYQIGPRSVRHSDPKIRYLAYAKIIDFKIK